MRASGGDRNNPMFAGFERGELALVVTGFGVNLIVPVSKEPGVYRQRIYEADTPPAAARPAHGGYPTTDAPAQTRPALFSIVGGGDARD